MLNGHLEGNGELRSVSALLLKKGTRRVPLPMITHRPTKILLQDSLKI
jgi:hypothetical protein